MKLGMMEFDIMGVLGLVISGTQFIPQVYKVWKTDNTESLSTMTIVAFMLGQILWIIHSITVNDPISRIRCVINFICFAYLFYKKYMNNEVIPKKDEDYELYKYI